MGHRSICFIRQDKKEKSRGGVLRRIKKAQRQRDYLQAQAEKYARMKGLSALDRNPVDWKSFASRIQIFINTRLQ